MAAIVASGQVYILNGQLTVATGPGGFVATGQQMTLLATVAVPNLNTGIGQDIAIPSGITDLAWLWKSAGSPVPQLKFSGVTSLAPYVDLSNNWAAGPPGRPAFGPFKVATAVDASVHLDVGDFIGGGGGTLYVLGIYAGGAVPATAAGLPATVQGSLSSNRVPVLPAIPSAILPFSVTLAAAANTTLLVALGGGNQERYLRRIHVSADNAAAGVAYALGTVAGGNQFGSSVVAATPHQVQDWVYDDLNIHQSALILSCTGTVGDTFRGFVTYSLRNSGES